MAKRYKDGMMMSRNDDRGAMQLGPSMIHDDMSKFCNLPTEVMMKDWPRENEVLGYAIPYDKFEAAKMQKTKDLARFRESFAKQK